MGGEYEGQDMETDKECRNSMQMACMVSYRRSLQAQLRYNQMLYTT